MSDNVGNGSPGDAGPDDGLSGDGLSGDGLPRDRAEEGQIPSGGHRGNGLGRRVRSGELWQGGRQAGARVAQGGRQAGVWVAQGVRSGQLWHDSRHAGARVAEGVRSGRLLHDGRQAGVRVAKGVRTGRFWGEERDGQTWKAVDRLFADRLIGQDDALDAAVATSAEAGLPDIAVSATQGKLLNLLARLAGARAILEVGTLGGYSTIWLARALPAGGRLISLEVSPAHAAVARTNLERAGLASSTEIRVGPAIDSLDALAREGLPPFDFVFIDADKRSNVAYFQAAIGLSRPGATIVVDNVVRDGRVTDEASTDADIVGTRKLLEAVGADDRVEATAIQTVGSKGYDGFLLAVVKQDREDGS